MAPVPRSPASQELIGNSGDFTLTNGASFNTAGNFSNSGTLTVGPASTFAVTGNYTQTTTGELEVQIGGAPNSGLFGLVAVSDTATLAGTFQLSLGQWLPGPATGQSFTVMNFAKPAGTFATFGGLGQFFTPVLNPTNLVLNVSMNAVDLALTTVSAPTAAIVGQAITVSWQESNLSSQALTGSWQDSVYLSTTPAITSGATLLGTVQHTAGLNGGGSVSASLTTALPAVAPGSYYVLVQADSLYQVPDPNRVNNTLAAVTGPLALTVPVLTLGVATNDDFDTAGQDRYYQVTVPNSGALLVTLESTASTGQVSLYVSQGVLPTLYNYQFAATANQSNQTILVPQVPSGGTYYILAHSVSGDAATAGLLYHHGVPGQCLDGNRLLNQFGRQRR